MSEQYRRIFGALQGISLGDALGMPTQSMSSGLIRQTYGKVDGLVSGAACQPIAPGMPAGSVTDDTEQALLVARLITGDDGRDEQYGHIDPRRLADALLAWEDDMKARGSLDLLGPSTKLALEQVRAGADIATTGRTGTTNGAAMRVGPVGMAHHADAPDFTDYVYESCRVTHNTVPGFQSAYLVAAAVSYGIDGLGVREAIERAVASAGRVEPRGAWSPKASVAARVGLAVQAAKDDIAAPCGPVRDAGDGADGADAGHESEIGAVGDGAGEDGSFLHRLRTEFGTSVESGESVAVAFALAYRYAQDPLQGLLAAANLGGDTDTMASIAGGMLGAGCGAGVFPKEMTDQVAEVSHLRLEAVAEGLLAVRGDGAAGGTGDADDASDAESADDTASDSRK